MVINVVQLGNVCVTVTISWHFQNTDTWCVSSFFVNIQFIQQNQHKVMELRVPAILLPVTVVWKDKPMTLTISFQLVDGRSKYLSDMLGPEAAVQPSGVRGGQPSGFQQHPLQLSPDVWQRWQTRRGEHKKERLGQEVPPFQHSSAFAVFSLFC